MYVVCVDCLKDFHEDINSVFPKTIVHLCIVHMIRNSVQSFSKKLDNKYQVIFNIGQRNWPGIAPFFLVSRMKSEK
ncbi:transposase [Rickettsia akari]|uniref:transposase n=1 Tax=Rickettsia akari TaxID=786 RepID=UPI0038CD964B